MAQLHLSAYASLANSGGRINFSWLHATRPSIPALGENESEWRCRRVRPQGRIQIIAFGDRVSLAAARQMV